MINYNSVSCIKRILIHVYSSADCFAASAGTFDSIFLVELLPICYTNWPCRIHNGFLARNDCMIIILEYFDPSVLTFNGVETPELVSF